MATIVATGFIPQIGPVDARYVISSVSDLLDVLKPYVGMHLWVTDIAKLIIVRLLQSQTDSFGTKYSIKSYSYTTLIDFTNKAVVAGSYSLAVPQSAKDLAISDSSSITVNQYLTAITQQLLRLPQQILDISIANAMLYGNGGVSSGGGSGVSDYIQLTNKPSINNVTLKGNLSSLSLGLASASDIPVSLSLLLLDALHRVVTSQQITSWNNKQLAITVSSKLNPQYIATDASNRFTTDTLKSTWNNKQDAITTSNKLSTDKISGLSTVATSGNFSDLTTRPTTLSGYGITDAKIQNGVITIGSNTITPLTSFTLSDPVYTADKPSIALKSLIPTALSGLSTDSTHRLVTDTLKNTWNNKQNAITSSNKIDADLVARLQLSGRNLTVGANQISIPLSDSRDLATVQRAYDIALLQALIFG